MGLPGCGAGRNLVYLLQSGYDVFAVDADARAVEAVRALAARLAPSSPNDSDHFRVEPVEAMSFPAGFADVAISSAVLHFARDDDHFDAMLQGTWRLVAGGGLMFCRLASSIPDSSVPFGWQVRLKPDTPYHRARLLKGRPASAGPFHWSRPLSLARRQRAVPRGRGDAGPEDRGARRRPARSHQDDGRAESAVHDDVGASQILMGR